MRIHTPSKAQQKAISKIMAEAGFQELNLRKLAAKRDAHLEALKN